MEPGRAAGRAAGAESTTAGEAAGVAGTAEPAGPVYPHPDPIVGAALSWACIPGAGLFAVAGLASRHGFAEISVRPAQFFDAVRGDVHWRRRFDDTGVRVGVIDALLSHLPGSPEPDDVPRGLRADFALGLDHCLEAAEALGARALNVAHYLGEPAPPDVIAAGLRQVAEAAEPLGVASVLEFIPGTGVPDLVTALDVVARAGHPNAGIMVDTWHFLRSGAAIAEIDALADSPVVEAQVSDRRTPPLGEKYRPMAGRLPLGDGEAPLVPIIHALRAAAPDVVLSLEIFPDEPGDPEGTVAYLAETTRAFLRGIGE